MKTIDELKKDLRFGDLILLSEISGVKKATVDKYFQGTRNPNTARGRKVMAAAQRLIESRKKLMASNNSEEEAPELPFTKDVA